MLEVNLPVVPQDHKVKSASLVIPYFANSHKQEGAHEKQEDARSKDEIDPQERTNDGASAGRSSELTNKPESHNSKFNLRKGNGSQSPGSRFSSWSGDAA